MCNDTLAQFLKLGRVERLSTDGVPVVQIRGTASTLAFSPHGAHVTGWHPAGGRPVLFMTGRSHFAEGKPIRGGVPICFPWFGPRPDDVAHGFARLSEWELVETSAPGDGETNVRFRLPASARPGWPEHRAEFAVTITDLGPLRRVTARTRACEEAGRLMEAVSGTILLR